MINYIINILNDSIKGIHADEKIYQLAQTFLFEGSAGQIIQGPGLLTGNDDIKYVGIDDIDSLIIYHKINGIQTRVIQNGRGNKTGDIRNLYSMSLICFWKMLKVKLLPDEMLLMIQSRMTNELLNITNVKTCLVTGLNANVNPLQVYAAEYGTNSDYRLPTDTGILQYNYQLELTINTDCLNKCITC